MVTGVLTLACLLLGAQVPGEPVPINTRNFTIPIKIEEARRKAIKELLLFVSSDQGRSWQQISVAEPAKEAFTFFAQTDGVYWFSVCVVDLKGSREPADVSKVAPGQKVLIDTQNPIVRIVSAERQGEDVLVSWEIQEDHPSLDTLKLEYRTPEAPSWMWTAAPVTPSLTGQTRIRPNSGSAVSLRMQLTDTAGNVGHATAEVKAAQEPITTASATTTSGPPPVPPPSAGPLPAPVPPPSLPPVPPPSNPAPVVQSAPGFVPGQPMTTASRRPYNDPAMDRNPAIQPTSLTPPESRSWPTEPVHGRAGAPGSPGDAGNRLLASSENNTSSPPPVAPPNAVRLPRGTAPQVQITKSTRVDLEYECTKFGPSGIGRVELYYTQDDGKTWTFLTDDPDLQSPISADLPGEGIYGFYLVVESKAHLKKRSPQPGDLPQMRLEVDTTPPVAMLYGPEADPRHRDGLVLSWEAKDRNLAPNPITLQWARQPTGPWELIVADHPNSGRYTWQLPKDIPVQVYLKLIVKDTAGNVSEAATQEPITVDLVEPEGVLRGLAGTAKSPLP